MTNICRFILLVASLLLSLPAAQAQSDDNTTRREINNIKRSPDYFYAESTLSSEDAARDAANVLLATYINDYAKEQGIADARRANPDKLEGVQYLSMKRGDNTRVFAYIPRATYLPGYTSPAKSAISPKSASSTKSDLSDRSDLSDSSDIPSLSPACLEAINELKAKSTLQAAVKHLAYLKSKNQVRRYGTVRDCRDAAKSLWLIAGNDPDMTLTAILGTGANSRTNYFTGADDNLGNYSGYNAVWFEF